MKRITEKQFIEILKSIKIEIDPKYPNSVILSYLNSSYSRFWSIPEEARKIPYFIETIINAIDEWKNIYVWKHMGSWTTKIRGNRVNDDVQAIIYKGIGIPDDTADIIQFDKNQIPELVTLVFNQLVFGWSVGDDLYIIPDHGKSILKTDHQEVIHAEFSTEETLNQFINVMKENDFNLPADIPDETFKKPEWMNQEPDK